MTSDAVIRPIEEQDVGAVVDLMAESFTSRTPDYFRQGLDRLSQRDVPQGGQRWGYLLEDEGAVRGAVLSISSVHDYGSFQQTYANISTWCVNPSHRGPLAKKLYNTAAGPEDWVTTNLSAAKHTVRTLDQLQFRARTTGQFIALSSRGKSALGKTGPARMISVQEGIKQGLAACHAATMEDHAARGCAVGCLATQDRVMPLIFLPRTVSKVVPCWQLIYCEDMKDFLAHSRPVLPWLRRKGRVALILDATGDIPEFYGKFMAGKAAKFIRGTDPVWDVDHTYSEVFYLGF